MSDNQIIWKRISSHTAGILKFILAHRESFKECSKKDIRTATIIGLIHRIMRNLRGIYILASSSATLADSVFLKLPVGIIIRDCLIDGLLALHIARNNN